MTHSPLIFGLTNSPVCIYSPSAMLRRVLSSDGCEMDLCVCKALPRLPVYPASAAADCPGMGTVQATDGKHSHQWKGRPVWSALGPVARLSAYTAPVLVSASFIDLLGRPAPLPQQTFTGWRTRAMQLALMAMAIASDATPPGCHGFLEFHRFNSRS